MRAHDGRGLRRQLIPFVEGVTSELRHCIQRERAQEYVVGLLLEGERKSMEPMAARLDPEHAEAKRQAVQHFVTHSPWEDELVRSALARRIEREIVGDAAWLIDDTGFP